MNLKGVFGEGDIEWFKFLVLVVGEGGLANIRELRGGMVCVCWEGWGVACVYCVEFGSVCVVCDSVCVLCGVW